VLDFFIVILAGVLLITIYNNVQINILDNSYSSFMGYSLFEVQTGSMEPEIKAGDWIVVKYEKDYELKDVVTFETEGEFVTHRVINKYGDTFVTQGDANNAKDSPISKEQIVGKMVKILPAFGIMRKTIFNPVVLVGLIVILYLTTSIFKKKADDHEDNALVRSLDEAIDKEMKKQSKKATKKDSKEVESNEEDVEELELEDTSELEVEDTEETFEPEELVDDVEEVVEETEEEDVTEEDDTDEVSAEDLEEKTMLFRMISVDSEEVDSLENNSVLEEVEEKTQEIPTIDATQEVIDAATEEKVKMTLELIQKKRKKCNNFIEKAMLLKREEIEEIVSILNLKQKYKVNEPSIKDALGDIYMDAKYYNNCALGELDENVKVTASKVEKTLLDCSISLFKAYKGTDDKYHDKLKKFLKIMVLINKLEEDYITISDIEKKKDTYTKKILRYLKYNDLPAKELKSMVTNILKVQRSYASMMKFLFNKLDTGMFQLAYNQVGKNKIYFTDLEHNIQFSKMYSDYIVDKTYTEGLVAEDKLEVLATLLSSQLVKDMLNKEFSKKYIVTIPDSLFTKQKKLEKIIGMFDDGHAKNTVLFLITVDIANDNKKMLRKLIQDNYHFAIDMSNLKNIRKKDESSLYMVDVLVASNSNNAVKEILGNYPKELTEKVLYTDVLSKVGK
jgi:signal peptidase